VLVVVPGRCRQRLRAGRRRGVGDPDDVAADVAREEVVEKGGYQERLGQCPGAHLGSLHAQQQPPADDHHAAVDGDERQDCRQVSFHVSSHTPAPGSRVREFTSLRVRGFTGLRVGGLA